MKRVFHKLTALVTTPTNKEKLKMVKKFSRGEWIIFLLILLLFPTNLAKLIELPSAYIQGVLVDYLLPKVYLTEFLVLLLLFLATIRLIVQGTTKRLKVRSLLPFLLLLPLLPSLFTSGDLSLSSLRVVEITLWGGFALWVKENIRWEKDRQQIIKALSFGVSWVALLALAQFFNQRHIFGYYFLGEPVIYPSLGGVAKTSFFGREVLRAYGTFPHPNVLGGAMAVIIPWLLVGGYLLPAGVAFLSLLVSFSRLAWVSLFFGLFLLGFLRTEKFWRNVIIAAFLVVSPPLLMLLLFFTDKLSVVRRVELLQSAWAMVRSSPFIGIGLGLFAAKLPAFGLPSGPTLFLQPVHNIFALVTAESGLLALVVLLLIFALAIRNAWRGRRLLFLVSLGQLIILGLFDHYLYTLPQGLFLLSLTLGLTFSHSEKARSRSDATFSSFEKKAV